MKDAGAIPLGRARKSVLLLYSAQSHRTRTGKIQMTRPGSVMTDFDYFFL